MQEDYDVQVLQCVVECSVAVLAEILLRSPRKLFSVLIQKNKLGSKYPEIHQSNFEKNFTGGVLRCHSTVILFPHAGVTFFVRSVTQNVTGGSFLAKISVSSP